MTPNEIIQSLTTYTGRFPEAAVKAAIEQREAIAPELLACLEQVASDPASFTAREDYMLHTYAALLLAQFRERRTYPLLIRIISAPGELPSDLFGDTVTEGLAGILASTFDGDLDALIKVALQRDAYPFVRSSVTDVITLLEMEGLIAREQMLSAFRRIFIELAEDDDPQAWNGIVSSACDASAIELLPEIESAFERGLVEPFYMSAEDALQLVKAPREVARKRFQYHHHLVDNVIDEMSGWAAFNPEPSRKPQKPKSYPTYSTPTARPASSAPKIGRNDPCPCGSGKKYKKCCLEKANGGAAV